MVLSILIVNWNTCAYLAACLKSIYQHPPSGDFEVIVVDNNSSDGSAVHVSTNFPNVVLLAESTNHGYARGNNLAFQRATGDYLLTLNPDTEILARDTFDRAIAELSEHGDCGVLSVRFEGPDGNTQHSIRGFPTLSNIMGAIFGIGDGYRLRKFDYAKSQIAPQPMGTFLLFKRSALESINASDKPFDESFPIFFNEVDLLSRLKARGWNCWYASEVWIKHHGGMSTRQVRKDMIWESHRSLAKYLRKHSTGLARGVLPLVNVFIWLGALVRARGVHGGFRP